ncbi:MarR family winged helix-turn-helix transcriptional regulator [Paenibacillus sp. S150]|uniref:MarR family winged helix-turn-helix transcriptional regulator n=1 Tax=Paenibacillus sp. S150 TaxID=2749826 RepID=UPI001C55FB54|nr:MarR family transcriptional regulator [Paenibacillus sp. S150]MBW4082162.1 MarR family transcriptional regulator [Paenibacillus sp. S150]
MPQQIDPLVERLGSSMWKVHRRIASQMSLHKEMGLTVPQFGLLRLISQEQKARVVQLADKLEVKSSAVTVMLDRLELLGLIAREPDENDRRAVIVSITPKGQKLLEEAQYRTLLLLSEHLAVLKPEELQNLADYLLMLEKQERLF